MVTYFLAKEWVKILIVPLFQLYLMMSRQRFFNCIVMIFFHKLTFILSYSMSKFVKIECHLYGKKNRSTFKIFKIVSSCWLIFDDVTAALSYVILS